MFKKRNILLFVFGMAFFFAYSLNAADDWKQYKTRHFVISYKDAPMDFVKEVENSAEQYYENISRDLGYTRYKGWTYDERARIFIYDNAEDYVKQAKRAPWSHGIAFSRLKVIKTYPAAHGFFDSVLPHELGHIIFREFVSFKAECPLWFEEGVAMYQEKAKRWGAHDYVRRAIKEERFIPLEELTSFSVRRAGEEDVELFYAEAASAVNFMINELGQKRFKRFCRELEEGRPFEWTLKSVYVRLNDGIEDLNKSWVKFLEQ